jgi:peptide-methionine (S)-S-oxide reductase
MIGSFSMADNKATKYEIATFGGGCFWGVEAAFRLLDGVEETSVGFMGGNVDNPSYKQVSYTETGHAEVCQVKYDPSKITYTELLETFFSSHDPTQLNRQGPDVGDQYRSVIFYHDEAQKMASLDAIKQIEEAKLFKRKLVTEIIEATELFKAEDYHQQYYEKQGVTGHCGYGIVKVTLNK